MPDAPPTASTTRSFYRAINVTHGTGHWATSQDPVARTRRLGRERPGFRIPCPGAGKWKPSTPPPTPECTLWLTFPLSRHHVGIPLPRHHRKPADDLIPHRRQPHELRPHHPHLRLRSHPRRLAGPRLLHQRLPHPARRRPRRRQPARTGLPRWQTAGQPDVYARGHDRGRIRAHPRLLRAQRHLPGGVVPRAGVVERRNWPVPCGPCSAAT